MWLGGMKGVIGSSSSPLGSSSVTTSPFVSIVSVCLNESKSVRRTIESVLGQTNRRALQYVFIDGGSTDGTVEILQEYRSQIDVCISEPDHGIYSAMNKGAAHATGDYLLFLNAGDFLVVDEVIRDASLNLPRVDLAHGRLLAPNGDKIKAVSVIDPRIYLRTRTLPHQATFIRRTFFDRIDGYDESFRVCGDYDFFVRAVFRHGASVRFFQRDISVFSPGGISSRESELVEAERRRVEVQIPHRVSLRVHLASCWRRAKAFVAPAIPDDARRKA